MSNENGPFEVQEDCNLYESRRFHCVGPCYVGRTGFEHEAKDDCDLLNRAWHSRDPQFDALESENAELKILSESKDEEVRRLKEVAKLLEQIIAELEDPDHEALRKAKEAAK